jgi:hypothetical protein
MPHYFFNLVFGDRVSPDEEGAELRDQPAAREEAFAIIRELSDPALGGNPRRWAGWFLQVADEHGAFLSAPIGHPALELVTKEWQPRRERPVRGPSRPVLEMAAPSSDKRLPELMRQILARRADAAALGEQNRKLREEISRIRLKCKEIRERAQFLIACAQRVEWAIEGHHGSAAKRPRPGRGGGKRVN